MKTIIPVMKTTIPFGHHGVTGGISVKLKQGRTLNDFCLDHLPHYNVDQYEAVAIRLYAGKEITFTIFALDKFLKKESIDIHKLPIKKFKIQTLPLAVLLDYFEEFNFTLSTGNYDIADMEVINN